MADDLRLPPRDEPDDVWAPYAVAGLHRGPDHTQHHNHHDREEAQP